MLLLKIIRGLFIAILLAIPFAGIFCLLLYLLIFHTRQAVRLWLHIPAALGTGLYGLGLLICFFSALAVGSEAGFKGVRENIKGWYVNLLTYPAAGLLIFWGWIAFSLGSLAPLIRGGGGYLAYLFAFIFFIREVIELRDRFDDIPALFAFTPEKWEETQQKYIKSASLLRIFVENHAFYKQRKKNFYYGTAALHSLGSLFCWLGLVLGSITLINIFFNPGSVALWLFNGIEAAAVILATLMHITVDKYWELFLIKTRLVFWACSYKQYRFR